MHNQATVMFAEVEERAETETLNSDEMSNSDHLFAVILDRIKPSEKTSFLHLKSKKCAFHPQVRQVLWPRLSDIVEFSAVVFHKCLYVIGGRVSDGEEILDSCLKYDPTENRWQQTQSLNVARKNFAAVVFLDRIFIIGGETSLIEPFLTTTVEYYETDQRQFLIEDSPCPIKRTNPRVAASNELRTIFLVGGRDEEGHLSTEIWCYSQKTFNLFQWSLIIPPSFLANAMFVVNPAIHIIKENLVIIGVIDGTPECTKEPISLAVFGGERSLTARFISLNEIRDNFSTLQHMGQLLLIGGVNRDTGQVINQLDVLRHNQFHSLLSLGDSVNLSNTLVCILSVPSDNPDITLPKMNDEWILW